MDLYRLKNAPPTSVATDSLPSIFLKLFLHFALYFPIYEVIADPIYARPIISE